MAIKRKLFSRIEAYQLNGLLSKSAKGKSRLCNFRKIHAGMCITKTASGFVECAACATAVSASEQKTGDKAFRYMPYVCGAGP